MADEKIDNEVGASQSLGFVPWLPPEEPLVSGRLPPNPALEAIRSMHNDLVYLEPMTSVKPTSRSIARVEKAIFTKDIPTLKDNLRAACMYSVDSNGLVVSHNDETQKHLLIEETVSLLECIYPETLALRKDGTTPMLAHSLQVGLIVALMNAPLFPQDRVSLISVAPSLLHDSVEDPLSGSNPAVKFRGIGRNMNEITLDTKQAMLTYIRKMYPGEYGGRVISKSVDVMTRTEIHDGMGRVDYYVDLYLREVYRHLWGAQGKMGDAKANALTIFSVKDHNEMLRLKDGIIPKIIPQALWWKKLGWVPFQLLMHGFKELARGTEYEGIDKVMRAPSERDVENFERGYVMLGERRKYSPSVIGKVPESGAPILTLYPHPDGYEMEIPFIGNLAHARHVIEAGFGKLSNDPFFFRSAPKQISSRLDASMVVFFKTEERADLHRAMQKCAGTYTEKLAGGELRDIFRGLDRMRKAQEIKKHWNGAMSQSKRLERFILYKVPA